MGSYLYIKKLYTNICTFLFELFWGNFNIGGNSTFGKFFIPNSRLAKNVVGQGKIKRWNINQKVATTEYFWNNLNQVFSRPKLYFIFKDDKCKKFMRLDPAEL